MNRRKALQSIAAVAAGAVAAPPARAASKEVATLLDRWNKAKAFTLKVADVMPESDYQFRPNPVEMGFGKLFTHIGNANMNYFSRIQGGPPPMKEPKDADKAATKKFLEDSFDWCAQILSGLTSEKLDEMYQGSGNAPAVSGLDLVLNGFIHTAHHRAQAEVYLRVKGLEPPRYAV
jgi:uncharacterized damage-inducible protein DinB